jgi:hypothetical protein
MRRDIDILTPVFSGATWSAHKKLETWYQELTEQFQSSSPAPRIRFELSNHDFMMRDVPFAGTLTLTLPPSYIHLTSLHISLDLARRSVSPSRATSFVA